MFCLSESKHMGYLVFDLPAMVDFSHIFVDDRTCFVHFCQNNDLWDVCNEHTHTFFLYIYIFSVNI